MAKQGLVVLVTGGSGFLGLHICRLLKEGQLEEGWDDNFVKELRILDLREPNQIVTKDQVTFRKGSVTVYKDVLEATKNVDVVVHTAGVIDSGGVSKDKIIDVNVNGTRFICRACLENNVKYLVHTSSLCVLQHWGDNIGILSNAEYPKDINDFPSKTYGWSKSVGEKLVKESNGRLCQDGKTVLKTCVLRPNGVYGDGDPYIIPAVLKAAASGALKFRIGNGLMDYMYVGNVAYAHLLAIRSLVEGEVLAGRALNLSHEVPNTLMDLSKPYMNAFGFSIPEKTIPKCIIVPIAYILEFVLGCVPLKIRPDIPLTRSAVEYVSCHGLFTDLEALRDLKFKSIYSPEEIFERTLEYLKKELPLIQRNGAAQNEYSGGTLGWLFFLISSLI